MCQTFFTTFFCNLDWEHVHILGDFLVNIPPGGGIFELLVCQISTLPVMGVVGDNPHRYMHHINLKLVNACSVPGSKLVDIGLFIQSLSRWWHIVDMRCSLYKSSDHGKINHGKIQRPG